LGDLVVIKNDTFARMLDGTYELWCAHIKDTKRHRQNRCFWCRTEVRAHNGLVRVRNTNLSALASETMWYQLIGIELLAVLLLFLPSSVSDECYNHVFLQKDPSRSS
jgi:hypothetical protein